MSMSAYSRPLTGIITVGVCSVVGLSFWPSKPIVAGIFALLAAYRFVMIIRQWPRSED